MISKRQLREAAQAAFGEVMVERRKKIEAARAALLPARDLNAMVDEVAEFGVGSGSLVIDVGASRGDWSQRIVDRYACVCVAIDLSPSRMLEARNKGLPALIADGDELPFADGSIDVVWCRDMIEMVADPVAILAEFALVLRPGGGVMLYVPVPTEALEPIERSHIMTLDMPDWWAQARIVLDDAIRETNFEVLRTEVMSPEFTEGVLVRDPAPIVAQIIEHAQLRRGRDAIEAAVGADWYARFEAWSRWQMYLVLGKIDNTLWLLRNPFGQPPSF